MTVWITSQLVARGIYSVELEDDSPDHDPREIEDGNLHLFWDERDKFYGSPRILPRGAWHRSLEEAIASAKASLAKQRKALVLQLKKIKEVEKALAQEVVPHVAGPG